MSCFLVEQGVEAYSLPPLVGLAVLVLQVLLLEGGGERKGFSSPADPGVDLDEYVDVDVVSGVRPVSRNHEIPP